MCIESIILSRSQLTMKMRQEKNTQILRQELFFLPLLVWQIMDSQSIKSLFLRFLNSSNKQDHQFSLFLTHHKQLCIIQPFKYYLAIKQLIFKDMYPRLLTRGRSQMTNRSCWLKRFTNQFFGFHYHKDLEVPYFRKEKCILSFQQNNQDGFIYIHIHNIHLKIIHFIS